VEDARTRLETEARALGNDVTERIAELGSAIQASLVAVAVTMVAAMLLGLATAATLYAVGLPLFAALWIVTGVALVVVTVLLRSAWRSGRRVIAPFLHRRDP